MPLEQLAKSQVETAIAGRLIATLKGVKEQLQPFCGNLTPDERQQYGSINERNKLIVGKANEFHTVQPELQTPDVDWNKFDASWESRSLFATVESLCHSIIEMASDGRILHDYDLYQMVLTDYDYAKYKANSTAATGGYTTKYEELKQFFGNPSGNNGSDAATAKGDQK